MVKKFLKEFKAFAIQGNVMNLAVGVMIGGAFSKIVSSLVGDIFTPLLGVITGGLDFTGLYIPLKGDATLNYGAFITNIIDFVLIALCIFLVVRSINKLLPPKAEEPKPTPHICPYCFTEVNAEATRCPACTSELPLAEQS
jgi:large conductance mechanosensitive channel protein